MEKSTGHTSKHTKTLHQVSGKSSAAQARRQSSEKPVKSLTPKCHRSSSDIRIDELDQKWSDRFNRLEALILAKTQDKLEPTFATVKVTPKHSPPVGAVRSTEPFIRPTDRTQVTDLSGTGHTSQRQATDKSHGLDTAKQPSTSDLPGSAQTDLAGTDSPILHQVSGKSSAATARRQSTFSMDTDSDSDFSDPPMWIFLWRKRSCLTRTLMLLLLTPTRPSLRNKLIEKL